jgi:hypothetical protein
LSRPFSRKKGCIMFSDRGSREGPSWQRRRHGFLYGERPG